MIAFCENLRTRKDIVTAAELRNAIQRLKADIDAYYEATDEYGDQKVPQWDDADTGDGPIPPNLGNLYTLTGKLVRNLTNTLNDDASHIEWDRVNEALASDFAKLKNWKYRLSYA